MNKEEFSALVASDIRNQASEEDQSLLRSAEMLPRWRDELTATMRKIDFQVTSHKAEAFRYHVECLGKGEKGKLDWVKYLAEDLAWRVSALRFKREAESKLAECKQLMRDILGHYPVQNEEIEIVRLRTAIARHKSEMQPGGEYSDADSDLWKVIEA